MIRRYPAYRDSGVEWLGEVPEGWGVAPVKAGFTIVGGATPKSEVTDYWDGDIIWVTPADLSDLPTNVLKTSRRTITELGLASCATSLVPAGSLLLSIRAPIGSLAISSGPVCTNQGCKALVARPHIHPSFYYFVLLAAREALNVLGRGSTFLEISGDQLGAFRVPMPAFAEQTAIAAFLDRETAKIDAMVDEQRRLVALLREKRQAVISHAVTKGLNPAAPMKPSGVDWLGDVPEGWEIAPLKRFGRFVAGAGFPHDEQGNYGEALPFFKVNALGKADADDRLVAEVDTISTETAKRLSAKIVPAGSIVFAKIGAALLLGRVRVVPVDCCIDNNLLAFVPAADHDADFFRHAMSFIRFDLIANPGTVPSLNESQIAEVRMTVPSFELQRKIVQEISVLTLRIDELSQEAETAITLLQERRAALISAAVTGKIDVRDLAPAETEAA